jgi:tetratricopeptide (TPR) repeat protein
VNPDELLAVKKSLPNSQNTILVTQLVNQHNGEVCYQQRIFPNRPDLKFKGAIHEQIDSNPDDYSFVEAPLTIEHYGYSDSAALLKKSERNLRIIEKELVKSPQDLFLHYHAAQTLINLNRSSEAVKHLQIIAFSDTAQKNHQELWEHSLVILAKLFRRMSDPATAIKLLGNLLSDNPESAYGRYYLGLIYFEEQLYSECRTQMEAFFNCELNPKGIPLPVDKMTGWGHYYLGKCLEHQGHFAKAVIEYQEAGKYLDNITSLYRDMGRAFSKSGDYNEARKYLNMCLEENPKDRGALRLLKQIAAQVD